MCIYTTYLRLNALDPVKLSDIMKLIKPVCTLCLPNANSYRVYRHRSIDNDLERLNSGINKTLSQRDDDTIFPTEFL